MADSLFFFFLAGPCKSLIKRRQTPVAAQRAEEAESIEYLGGSEQPGTSCSRRRRGRPGAKLGVASSHSYLHPTHYTYAGLMLALFFERYLAQYHVSGAEYWMRDIKRGILPWWRRAKTGIPLSILILPLFDLEFALSVVVALSLLCFYTVLLL